MNMKTAHDIMTQEVVTVSQDLAVEKLAEILWENRISGAPVIDDNENVVAVVTESDLIDQAKKVHIPTMISILDSVIMLEKADKIEKEIRKMTGTTVKDICTRKLVTVSPDSTLDEVATIMAEQKVHTLPVLSEGKLVGVVGKADVIRTLAKK
jgi:CBS-domain-containing membrane protein